MRKIIFSLLVVWLCSAAQGQVYEGLKLINAANWAAYFNDLLGYQSASRGHLHFYPSDIYLLYKTISPETPFTINKYKLEKEAIPFQVERIPDFAEKTNSEEDIEKHARLFKSSETQIEVFPSLGILIIYVDGSAYAKVRVQAGLPEESFTPVEVEKDKPIEWDPVAANPTQPGNFSVLQISPRFSGVPFGAWLREINGAWAYRENGWWFKAPAEIAHDLRRPPEKRIFAYFDENPSTPAYRWGGNNFGKYVLLWSADGVYRERQMGFAPAQLLLEQVTLVKDLVYYLTADDPKEFEYEVPPVDASEPRLLKARLEVIENRLPRRAPSRQRALGLFNYFEENRLLREKMAGWRGKFRNIQPFLMELRAKLNDDFNRMGVLSLENRQNILERWLNERLEFKPAAPPAEAKYVQELRFATFFKPDEKPSVFTAREGAVMREKLRRYLSGEAIGFELASVDALNNYNFGLLLNEILGDLYRSHGCLHASPRNSHFLFEILPVGAVMNVHKYSETISPEALSSIPRLADLVDFAADLERRKNEFSATREVRIEVYPAGGVWVLFLKDLPVAQLSVKGGPQKSFYFVQGRDAKGRPVFENTLAYPTTPGKYYIFKKVTNYLSNLYRDTTIIPMGGTIRRAEKGWVFLDNQGLWRPAPKVVEADLNRPPETREFTYFDRVRNSSGEVVELKWGSHPFGKYSILTSANRKTPFPELIHSSGDLMMEERQIINDLITLLSTPYDTLEECVDYDPNFNFYKKCFDFVKGASSGEALGLRERAAFKLHYNLPLASEEAAAIPPDTAVAAKIMRGEKPDSKEMKILAGAGIASRQKGKTVINLQKVYGLHFDNYQYAVTIQKYAHHYDALQRRWGELNDLRKAMLKDFNHFVIKDPALFHNFMRELMLSRTRIEKLTQQDAFRRLGDLL